MLWGIIVTIILFIVLFCVGLLILLTISKTEKHYLTLSASPIVGVAVYIFLLNLTNKFVHGLFGIVISTIGILLIGLILSLKLPRHNIIYINLLKDRQNAIMLILVLLVFVFSVAKMFSLLPAADSNMQWSYAGSFARGNYPLKVPWQPDLSPNYHLGAYYFEGAIMALTGLSLIFIHSLVNIYFFIPNVLMSIFLLWDKKYTFGNIWLIIAGIVLFISFGVIIIIYPGFLNILHFSTPISNLNQIIAYVPAKAQAGAPLVNLNILSMLPARSLAIGLLFLTLFFTRVRFTNSLLKILTFSLIFSITALVEESIFMPMFSVLIGITVLSCTPYIAKYFHLQQHRRSLLLIVLLSLVISVLQGGFISDNLFSKGESTLRVIYTLNDPSFLEKVAIFKNTNLGFLNGWKLAGWLVIQPLFLVIILLSYAFYKKNYLIGLIGLFSAATFVFYLNTEYIYCNYCSYRLYSMGNLASGYGLILLLFLIFKNLSSKTNLFVLIFLSIALILPTTLPDLVDQYQTIRTGLIDNTPQTIINHSPANNNSVLIWAADNLPINANVLVIDREFPSPSGPLSFQYQGINTLYGSQFIRTNRPEPGIEYFDLALTLNPSLIRQTGVRYIYLESESIAYPYTAQIRTGDLGNKEFFKVLNYQLLGQNNGKDVFRILYEIEPLYFDLQRGGQEITDGMLIQLRDLIPDNKSVYISDYGETKLSFWYRMAVSLTLKDKDIRRNLSQAEYQVIETTFPRTNIKDGEVYDYYILPVSEKPDFPSTKIWGNILATAWMRANNALASPPMR